MCICAFVICGCKGPRIDDYRPSAGPVTPETLENEASEAEILLAEVNQTPITLAEYQRRLRTLSEQGQQRESTAQARRQFLEAIIMLHLLAREAAARGLATDPSVALAEAAALRDVVVEREGGADLGFADIGEDAVAEYHYAHTYRYNRPEQRHLRLLVTSDFEAASAARGAVDRTDVASVADNLRRFRELASTTSVYPELVEVGFVSRDTLSGVASEAVVEAAFALEQPGNVTEPLRVSAGWAVLQLVEQRRLIDEPLEAASESIRDEILAERRAAVASDIRWQVRESARVEIDEALLARLEAAAPPAPTPPAWVGINEFVLNSRLTPTSDLTMLGPLLRAPEPQAPEEVPSGPEPQQP